MKRAKLLVVVLSAVFGLQAQELPILGGELSNSAVTSVEDVDEVIPRMRTLGLNTVLVPAYWEFIEPEEGKFDFTLIDRTIQRARENNLKIIFLWFGAWKNSMSCYAPLWFKKDTKRFPRACTKEGKPLEIASAFSENVFQADNRAFEMLIKHLVATGQDVVSMIQVENEIGMRYPTTVCLSQRVVAVRTVGCVPSMLLVSITPLVSLPLPSTKLPLVRQRISQRHTTLSANSHIFSPSTGGTREGPHGVFSSTSRTRSVSLKTGISS